MGLFEYDGSAISNRIYKLTKSNPLIEAECSALLEAIADPDCESDPLNFDPQAYLIKGQVKIGENDISVKLISMQKPITVLRHKFLSNDGVFKEISDKVLSLKFMVNLDYLFRSSYMSVYPVFSGFPGILDTGRSSHIPL